MMLGEFDLSLYLFIAVSAVHEAETAVFYLTKDGLQYKILVDVEVNKVWCLYFNAFFFQYNFPDSFVKTIMSFPVPLK
jgi:hypothetical protein